MLKKKLAKTCLVLSVLFFNFSCVNSGLDNGYVLNIPLHEKIETKTGYFLAKPDHTLHSTKQTLTMSPAKQALYGEASGNEDKYICTDLLACTGKKNCDALQKYNLKKVSVNGYYIEENDYDYNRDAFFQKLSSILFYKGIIHIKTCFRNEIFVVTSIKEIPDE